MLLVALKPVLPLDPANRDAAAKVKPG